MLLKAAPPVFLLQPVDAAIAAVVGQHDGKGHRRITAVASSLLAIM